ncbi:hypothetical protein L798_14163 [Zootermopsis nevadensis]|uniref:Uncharacterized protein n=1 Tax=Zootermopsis nevadensis TaxID=136037 RepID=A0A067RS65_ZOONE|nr:hypothetical protein L798_14163 [Zootermopsis nevadensis]
MNNPADHLSRGRQADGLCSLDSWWHGPDWLVKHHASWPHDITIPATSLPEARKTAPQVLTVTTPEPLLHVSRFSSYWKLLHITAWVFRFTTAVKEKRKFRNNPTALELESARAYWIRKVQEQCFTTELTTVISVMKELPL